MNFRPRVYISCPFDPRGRFLDKPRNALREGILSTVKRMGFEPQEFGVSGLPQGDDWDFKRSRDVMRQCDGALVIALARWFTPEHEELLPIPSEYNHFEGALAVAQHLPLLVIAEENMPMRGILTQGGASVVLKVSVDMYQNWLSQNALESEPVFQRWVENIRGRRDVFFGYCSKADSLAGNIKQHLIGKGLTVMDWATDFRLGRTIMQEVARAAEFCRCGLFLFTSDDPVDTPQGLSAIPRDNVLLEAGYFSSAKSPSRVLIVRETGTKMPADLGGVIYLSMSDRNAWQSTADRVADTIYEMVIADVS